MGRFDFFGVNKNKTCAFFVAALLFFPQFSSAGIWQFVKSIKLEFSRLFAASTPVFTYPAGNPFNCASASGYQDPALCTISGETPIGSFSVPAVGQSYIDSNFGGTVKLLTGPGFIHTYSFPTPVSANNKYLAVRNQPGGRADILDFQTGTTVASAVPFSQAGRFWDPVNDEIYYYFSGAKILKYDLQTKTATTLQDYSQAPYQFTKIETGGSSELARDYWLAFWDAGKTKICAANVQTLQTYCDNYSALDPAKSKVGWNGLDYINITKGVDSATNKRYVILFATPALGVWSINTATQKLDFEFRGPDSPESNSANHDNICDPNETCLSTPHADLMQDSDGKQYIVTEKGSNSPCEDQLVTLELAKGNKLWVKDSQGGGRHTIMTSAKCGSAWPSAHIGCARNAPVCVISYSRNAKRDPADRTTAIPIEPHRDEIFVMKGNGQEIRRLAVTRSIIFTTDTYWPQPRAAITNDGNYVISDSNFGTPNSNRVTVISINANAVIPSATPTPTPTPTLTPTPPSADGKTPTPTPPPAGGPTPTPTLSLSPTPTPPPAGGPTPTPTPIPTATPTPSRTPTPTPPWTPTLTPTPPSADGKTPTPTPPPAGGPTPTPADGKTPTPTPTPTPYPTSTLTPTPFRTATPIISTTPYFVPSPSPNDGRIFKTPIPPSADGKTPPRPAGTTLSGRPKESSKAPEPQKSSPPDRQFGALEARDIHISKVAASSVTIQWTTDQPTTAVIKYGTTPGLKRATFDSSLTKNHKIKIQGLVPKKLYFYRIISRDKSGKEVASKTRTFTTAAKKWWLFGI